MPVNIYISGLAILGAIFLILLLLDTIWGFLQICRAVLAPYFIPNEETSLVKKFGQWALITGSTDGIGKAYAHELAKRNINIVLVSRNEQKLRNTANELETLYAVKTKIITVDFSNASKAVSEVKKELGDLQINILVNNVGKQYEYPMYLGEVPEKELNDIINVNVATVTLMSRAFIGDMKRQKKGAIVNISSGSELQPLPLMTVYAATKAYIRSFSAALRYEYSKYNITIQHISPLFLNTKMNDFSDKLRETTVFVPDAPSYAKYAVWTLGKMNQSSGYWSHGLQSFVIKLSPTWLRMYIGAYLNKEFRKDYFKKNCK